MYIEFLENIQFQELILFLSLLNVAEKTENSKPKDPVERLAHHLSDWETNRFGEYLGVSSHHSSLKNYLTHQDQIKILSHEVSQIRAWKMKSPLCLAQILIGVD